MRIGYIIPILFFFASSFLTGCGNGSAYQVSSGNVDMQELMKGFGAPPATHATGREIMSVSLPSEKTDILAETASLPVEKQNDERQRNPFISGKEQDRLDATNREIIGHLQASAIVYSGQRSYAVVAGRIIQENDMMDGKHVVKINARDIILQDSQGEYIILLKNQ